MKKWIVLAAVLSVAVLAPSAQATVLSPGGTSGVGAISLVTITGSETLVGNSGPYTVTSGAFTATMQSQVYQDTGTGWLDFVYTVSNALDSKSDLHRVTMFSYPGTSFTDVYYSLASSATPFNADRFGTTVGFNFHPADESGSSSITPGTGVTLIIRTHDTSFGPGLLNAIDGSVASVDSFAPSVAPLPSSLVLFGTGILGFAGRLARRFRKGYLCLA